LSLLKANVKLPGTHLQELENTAKTRGRPVTKVLPQALILPEVSPKECLFFGEIGNSRMKNNPSSVNGANWRVTPADTS